MIDLISFLFCIKPGYENINKFYLNIVSPWKWVFEFQRPRNIWNA